MTGDGKDFSPVVKYCKLIKTTNKGPHEGTE